MVCQRPEVWAEIIGEGVLDVPSHVFVEVSPRRIAQRRIGGLVHDPVREHVVPMRLLVDRPDEPLPAESA